MLAYLQVILLVILSTGLVNPGSTLIAQPDCPTVNGTWLRTGDRKRMSLGHDNCDILGVFHSDTFSHVIIGVWNPQQNYYDITIRSTKNDKGCRAELKGKLEIIKEQNKTKIRTTVDQVVNNSCTENLEFNNIIVWTKL
jgi:hypothetical protein